MNEDTRDPATLTPKELVRAAFNANARWRELEAELLRRMAPASPIPYETARERLDSEVEKHSITERGTT